MDPIPPELFLSGHSPVMQEIARKLQALVRRAVPEAIEAVRPGWQLIGYDIRVGRRTTYFAWVWPENAHVHLGFQRGVLMDDPERLLKGAGVTKQVRWLTIGRPDQIREAEFAWLVREAARVARMSRSERLALAMDREEAMDRQEPETTG
jgi:hypothetical protein